MTLLQVLSVSIYLKIRYSLKYFAPIYRAQYEAAMLVYLSGTPTWQPEISVNIWNLLWLSRQLIICVEQISAYISTFPNTLTSERYPIRGGLKSKGLHKLCSVFEGIQEPFILSLACKSVVY